MPGKLVVIAAIAGAAYWYWTGPYQQNRTPTAEQQWLENEQLMKNCRRKEESMSAAAGLGGALIDTGEGVQNSVSAEAR